MEDEKRLQTGDVMGTEVMASMPCEVKGNFLRQVGESLCRPVEVSSCLTVAAWENCTMLAIQVKELACGYDEQ